jgi:hypothetical protein
VAPVKHSALPEGLAAMKQGPCWRETALEATDFETVVNELLGGQYYTGESYRLQCRGGMGSGCFWRDCLRVASPL